MSLIAYENNMNKKQPFSFDTYLICIMDLNNFLGA